MEKITVEQLKEFLCQVDGLFKDKKSLAKRGFQGIIQHLGDFNVLGELMQRNFPNISLKPYIEKMYLKAYGLDSLYSETDSFFQGAAFGACRLFTLLDFYFNDDQEDDNRRNIAVMEEKYGDFEILLQRARVILPNGNLWKSGVIFYNPLRAFGLNGMMSEYSLQLKGKVGQDFSAHCGDIILKDFLKDIVFDPKKAYSTWCLFPHSGLIGQEKTWLEQTKIIQEISEVLIKDRFQYEVRLATIWEIMFLAFSFYEITGNQILSSTLFFRTSSFFEHEPLLFGFLKNKPVITLQSVIEKDYPILLGEANYHIGVLPLIILS